MLWLILAPLQWLLTLSILALFLVGPFYRVQPNAAPLMRKMSLLVFLIMCLPFYDDENWHATVFHSALLQLVDWLVRHGKLLSEGFVVTLYVFYQLLVYLPALAALGVLVLSIHYARGWSPASLFARLASIDRGLVSAVARLFTKSTTSEV